jgi:type IV pilus modification protein PilV
VTIRPHIDARSPQSGYSFLEVLISLIILTSGILAIINFYPVALKASSRAEIQTKAALLAQRKADEIRRDDDSAGSFINSIRTRQTQSAPVVFSDDSRFTYSFCGRSVIDPSDDLDDSADNWFVPRVIVSYNPAFRPPGDVLYELRFEQ